MQYTVYYIDAICCYLHIKDNKLKVLLLRYYLTYVHARPQLFYFNIGNFYLLGKC